MDRPRRERKRPGVLVDYLSGHELEKSFSPDQDVQPEPLWDVDDVLDYRRDKDGEVEVLVRWAGGNPTTGEPWANSWEALSGNGELRAWLLGNTSYTDNELAPRSVPSYSEQELGQAKIELQCVKVKLFDTLLPVCATPGSNVRYSTVCSFSVMPFSPAAVYLMFKSSLSLARSQLPFSKDIDLTGRRSFNVHASLADVKPYLPLIERFSPTSPTGMAVDAQFPVHFYWTVEDTSFHADHAACPQCQQGVVGGLHEPGLVGFQRPPELKLRFRRKRVNFSSS